MVKFELITSNATTTTINDHQQQQWCFIQRFYLPKIAKIHLNNNGKVVEEEEEDVLKRKLQKFLFNCLCKSILSVSSSSTSASSSNGNDDDDDNVIVCNGHNHKSSSINGFMVNDVGGGDSLMHNNNNNKNVYKIKLNIHQTTRMTNALEANDTDLYRFDDDFLPNFFRKLKKQHDGDRDGDLRQTLTLYELQYTVTGPTTTDPSSSSSMNNDVDHQQPKQQQTLERTFRLQFGHLQGLLRWWLNHNSSVFDDDHWSQSLTRINDNFLNFHFIDTNHQYHHHDPPQPPFITRNVNDPMENFDLAYKRLRQYATTNSHVHELIQLLEHELDRWIVVDKQNMIIDMNRVCLSFNGGKDCTVLLHALATILYGSSRYELMIPKYNHHDQRLHLLLLDIEPMFAEQEQYLHRITNYYNCHLLHYRSSVDMKDALHNVRTKESQLEAIFMGVRRSDLWSPRARTTATTVQCTDVDDGWPRFTRVQPLLDWSYEQIWHYIEHLNVPYCPLYDMCYTSIGAPNNTVPNERLVGSCVIVDDGDVDVDGNDHDHGITKPPPTTTKAIQYHLPAACLMQQNEERNNRL